MIGVHLHCLQWPNMRLSPSVNQACMLFQLHIEASPCLVYVNAITRKRDHMHSSLCSRHRTYGVLYGTYSPPFFFSCFCFSSNSCTQPNAFGCVRKHDCSVIPLGHIINTMRRITHLKYNCQSLMLCAGFFPLRGHTLCPLQPLFTSLCEKNLQVL